MPDWERFVRHRLALNELKRERRERIVRELAEQLEDCYQDALSRGLAAERAEALARGQVRDWSLFEREIREVDWRHQTPQLSRWADEVVEAGQSRKGRWEIMANLIQDLRFAIRQFPKNPGFAAVVVLTLALGIGASAAIFSFVNAILWEPLPYLQPDRLVRLWDSNEEAGLPFFSVSISNYLAWRERNHVFVAVGAFREAELALAGEHGPEQIEGAHVTASLFDVLASKPALGRGITPDEDRPGGESVAVLTDGLWKRRFGADPGIVGATVTIEGQPCTVVGVMPPGFEFPIRRKVELLVPYRLVDDPKSRGSHFLRVLARMKPGVTVESARAEMDRIAIQLQKEFPGTNDGFSVALLSLHEATVESVQSSLLILFAAVGVVLLIAGVNIAGLLLARGATRIRELALRAVLGASRGRILRQLLTENILSALLGAAAGFVASIWLTRALVAWMPEAMPRLGAVRTDGAVLLFAVVVALLAACLTSLVPGLAATRLNLGGAVAQGGRTMSGGRASHRWRSVFVVVEVALALVLLVSGGLLLRSMLSLQRVDPGFSTSGVLTADIRPLEADYPTPPDRTRFYREAVERISSIPGVEAAGIVHRLPLTGNSVLPVFLEGEERDLSKPLQVNWRAVSPGYFAALGIPLRLGRPPSQQETWERTGAALVNQSFASRFWPGEDPLGRRFRPDPKSDWITVVGVVADVRESSLTEPAEPAVYLPYSTAPVPTMTLVVRVASAPLEYVGLIRDEVQRVNAGQPVGNFATLDDFLGEMLAGPRLYVGLIGVFGAIGLFLAVVGLYGLLAFVVSQRMHEFGIRVALGAKPRQILHLVMRRGILLIGIGVIAGLGVSVFATRLLESQLFGVQSLDPTTFATVAALLVVVALSAVLIPARRATRVDPMVTLRSE